MAAHLSTKLQHRTWMESEYSLWSIAKVLSFYDVLSCLLYLNKFW